MREYRILKKGTRYYPQVRERKWRIVIKGIPLFLHISEWKRIERREVGFDLTDADDFVFGEKNILDAEAIFMDYEVWKQPSEPAIVYKHYSQSFVEWLIHRRNRPVYKVPEELLKETSNQNV
jgi:hypothetical protein